MREATSEIYGPRVYSLSFLRSDLLFAFEIYFYLLLFSDLLFQKSKNNLLHLFLYLFYFVFYSYLFIQSHTILSRQLDNFLRRYPSEGLTTPHKRRVASICSLCAGTVYIVLLGSPTGLIPWLPTQQIHRTRPHWQHPRHPVPSSSHASLHGSSYARGLPHRKYG